MVCNTKNSIYQIPIVGSNGMAKGLFRLSESAAEMAPNDRVLRRIWRAVPGPHHVEKLVLTNGFDGTRGFGLLVEEPDGHWMRDMPNQKAASWLIDRDYDLPDQLKHLAPTESDPPDRTPRAHKPRKPLAETLLETYDRLKNRAMSVEQLVKEDDPHCIRSKLRLKRAHNRIRQHFRRIRKSGYKIEQQVDGRFYRPDAPPPESSVT